MENEIELNGVKYRRVVDPEPELLKVGDWVEFVEGEEENAWRNGDIGQIADVDSRDVNIPYHIKLQRTGDTWWAAASRVVKIDPPAAPAKPALKYKVGDIVVTAIRIVTIDAEDEDMPYGTEFVGDPDAAIFGEVWASKKALEPDRPVVGDKVIAWDSYTEGKLLNDDDDDFLQFEVSNDWYDYAVKVD